MTAVPRGTPAEARGSDRPQPALLQLRTTRTLVLSFTLGLGKVLKYLKVATSLSTAPGD